MSNHPFPFIMAVFLANYILLSACAVYMADKEEQSRHFSYIKGLLMPTLLLFYLCACAAKYQLPNVFMMLAIALGFIGDVVLERGPKALMIGLLAFLLGHVAYVVAFVWLFRPEAFPKAVYLVLAVYAVFGLLVLSDLLRAKTTKGFGIPLTLYFLVLTALSFSCLMRMSYTSTAGWLVPFIGSLLFIASDTMLAYRIFKEKDTGLVMVTYTLAQLFLVVGEIVG